MNLVRRAFLAMGLLVLGLTVHAAVPAASAEEAVERYVARLLARVEEIMPWHETDRERYYAEVERALEEFVDFREVARGVMAQYGAGPRGASPEQLERFAEVFKASMVEFYGSALTSYGGQDYEMLPSRPSPDPENATNVRMRVSSENGDGFELQYTMFLDAAGQWKLKNLYVEGVNLRRQYHSRFDDLMARTGYDIDQVIELWQVSE